MKKLTLLLLTLVIGASWYVFADQDYSRLKKDVGVMNQIIQSAFSVEGCRGCAIKVEGKYLADQGFLFIVASSRAFSFNTEDFEFSNFSYYFSEEDMEELENIPEMVTNIVNGVIDAVPVAPTAPEIVHQVKIVDDSTRIALREIRRERRHIEQQIRENEIELIHADEDDRKELEAHVRELEEEVATLESRQEEVAQRVTESREKQRQLAEEKRQKREQVRSQQQNLVQAKVLQAFCDYGSTLRSLPNSERVTIIFESARNDSTEDTIYVLEKDDVVDCDRDEDALKSRALSYRF